MVRRIRALPAVGTKLKGNFKGSEYYSEVVASKESKDGRAILYDGKVFDTMTAAAKEITKQSTNGWRFWKIKD